MKDNRGFAGIGIVCGLGVFLLSYLVISKVQDHLVRQDLHPDPLLFDYVAQHHNDPKAQRRHERLLKMKLKTAADPNILNENGNTPLHVALSQPNPSYSIIRILLKFGADPDFPDPEGVTPLHLAARHGHRAVMARLIKAGGDPFIVTRGQTETPYAMAVRLGNDGAVDAIERSKNFRKFKKDGRK